MTIEKLRLKMDEIDLKLLSLLNERADVAVNIGKIKMQRNLAVYDQDREKIVLQNIQQQKDGQLSNESKKRIFKTIIEECRKSETYYFIETK